MKHEDIMYGALTILNMVAIFVLTSLLFAHSVKADEPSHQCKIATGDVGDFQYRASSMLEAMTKTSTACSDARVELYVKLRGEEPDTDRKILFIEACVNDVVCWEN